MFQGQLIRSAAIADVRRNIAGPDALARGLAIGLPLSLSLWAALAVIIF